MLDQRRLQLKNDPEAYLFGTDAGYRQVDFDRMWHAVFELAEIPYGRDLGSCGTRSPMNSVRVSAS
jgi:hypothetical protein